MTTLLVYQLLIGYCLAFGGYVFLALAKQGWRRWGGPAFFGTVLAGMIAVTILSMGIPRPLWSFVADHKEYTLIAWTFVEDKAIYVWVQASDGDSDPVVIQLPWSKEKADAITGEMTQLNQNNQDGIVKPGQLARGETNTVVGAPPIGIPVPDLQKSN